MMAGRLLGITMLLLVSLPLLANTLSNAQKIKQIDHKINQIQQSITQENNKKKSLHQLLKQNEQHIGHSVQQLHVIHRALTHREQTITGLKQQLIALEKQLEIQKNLLKNQVIAIHKLPASQGFHALSGQPNPQAASQMHTYHKHLIASWQKNIQALHATQQSLITQKNRLHSELHHYRDLQRVMDKKQHQLKQSQNTQEILLKTIDKDIQARQHQLSDIQRNKIQLTQLIQTLAKRPVFKPQGKLGAMQHRLPHPVPGAPLSVHPDQPGVTFLAPEGTTVHAVYPGRVIFSDWLKGYGLLLIVDHGNGFMTLYAHNQALFKNKGSSVNIGEQIATVGHSGGITQNGLYFEIRKNGKTIPAKAWLS